MPSTSLHSSFRAEWFAARALLASRRLRPYVPVGLLAFVVVIGAFFAVRGYVDGRAPSVQYSGDRSRISGRDTLVLVSGVRTARLALAAQDSALQALLFRMEARAAAPVLPAESQRTRDSVRALLVQLDAALNRAAKAPLSASYRALANAPSVRTLEGVQSLIDTLDLLDRARLTLDPAEAPQREFAQLTQRSNAIGAALQAIGQARYAAMTRQVSTIEESGATGARRMDFAENQAVVRSARESAQVSVAAAESLLRDARRWHATAQGQADAAASVRSQQLLGASPAVAVLAALLIAGVLVFTLALTAEARRPTVAHAREVERVTDLPVLGTAHPRHLPDAGRARLRLATGIDPFRMVYLTLTASGTRERTVCITGDDPEVVAAVAGRLAVSAAADKRATLVVDVAPEMPSTTRYFGERTEPGFTEAIAAVRLWREVARSVGASEGLGLDVVPAGARRADTAQSVAMDTNRSEFHLFASEYDFAVIAAPSSESLATVVRLCDRPATIYVARIAQTPLDAAVSQVKDLQGLNLNLHGIILVDVAHK